MSKLPCLECGSPTSADVCEGCWLQIRNATEKMWRQAGVEPAHIPGWVKAGFGPYSAPKWIGAGYGPVEAERLRSQSFGIDTDYSFEASGFTVLEADEWRDAEFTLDEAREWTDFGFDFGAAEEWREAGLDPEQADAWLTAGFTVEEAEDWAVEGIDIAEAFELRDRGDVPNDASGWGETPFRQRSVWAAANVDPAEASAWSVLIDRGGSRGRAGLSWSRFKPVEGLTIAEALSWLANGFSSDRSERAYFKPFRDAGLPPSDAKRFLEFLLETDVFARRSSTLFDHAYSERFFLDAQEDADRIRALASYEEAGIPWTVEIASRWRLMSAESILEAVDLGYEDAYEYESFSSLGIPADDVRRLSELVDDIELVEGLWAAEQMGISAEIAEPWISFGFEVSEIEAWGSAGLAPLDASLWNVRDFTADTAKQWLDVGVHDATLAAAWRAAGFESEDASSWILSGFALTEAKGWVLANVDPEIAARRRSAGLRPPHAQ